MTPASSNKPSDAATIERAFSLANEAMFTVALQRRRVRSSEPEDHTFVGRRWADLQFLIVALRRLRRAAELAEKLSSVQSKVSAALRAFDETLPAVKIMRDVGEHIDAYALDHDKRHNKDIDRRMLQVGSWDGTTEGAQSAVYEGLSKFESVEEASPVGPGALRHHGAGRNLHLLVAGTGRANLSFAASESQAKRTKAVKRPRAA